MAGWTVGWVGCFVASLAWYGTAAALLLAGLSLAFGAAVYAVARRQP